MVIATKNKKAKKDSIKMREDEPSTKDSDLRAAIDLLGASEDFDGVVDHVTNIVDENQDLLAAIDSNGSNLQTELPRKNIRKALIARNALRLSGDVSGARNLVSKELGADTRVHNI